MRTAPAKDPMVTPAIFPPLQDECDGFRGFVPDPPLEPEVEVEVELELEPDPNPEPEIEAKVGVGDTDVVIKDVEEERVALEGLSLLVPDDGETDFSGEFEAARALARWVSKR
jgi:hypothetical protein